ncbi:MAG: BspA family leucine-rich repeat surface protein, partial [Gammaproteobacteria bacterium]|nr:BspA family leucine-rich repeat surface protein [Gammaproteobacteria bacterium]
AIFTPNIQEGSAAITVKKGMFQNAGGNKNVDPSDITLAVDQIAPTVNISSATVLQLNAYQKIKITFSLIEKSDSVGFAAEDITVTNGGQLEEFKQTATPTIYEAILSTNLGNSAEIISISIASGKFADAFGNTNVASNTLDIQVDAKLPEAEIVTTATAVQSSVANIKIKSTEKGSAYLVEWTYGRSVIIDAIENNIDLVAAHPTQIKKISIDADTETNIAITGLADGSYKLFVVDDFGNVSIAPLTTDNIRDTIAIDNVNPVIGSVTPDWGFDLDAGESQNDQKISIVTTDMNIKGQIITLNLNGKDYRGNVQGNTQSTSIITIASADLQDLSSGNHDYTINVTDIAGNIAMEKTGTFSVAKEQLFIEGNGGNTRLITFHFDKAVTDFDQSDITVQNGALVAGSFKVKTGATNQYTIEVIQNTKGGTHENIAITVAKDSFKVNGDFNADTFKNTTNLNNLSKAVKAGFDFINFDTSHAITAVQAFQEAGSFDANISGWNTTNITDMTLMFNGATAFNQNINTNGNAWNTVAVTNMHYMFKDATAFNQNISDWNTNSVSDMREMFEDATAFNQDLGRWNISSLTKAATMFTDSGMDLANMDKTLQGWAKLDTSAGETAIQNGVTWGVANYTDATARQYLIDTYNWTINDAFDGTNTLKGTSAANTLAATTTKTTVHGLGGNDTITGSTSADTLVGGAGNDSLTGGS